MPLPRLVRYDYEWQQCQMTRTLDFPREFALAAGAVSSLAARLDLSSFANVAAKRFNILVVETLTGRAVTSVAEPSPTPTIW